MSSPLLLMARWRDMLNTALSQARQFNNWLAECFLEQRALPIVLLLALSSRRLRLRRGSGCGLRLAGEQIEQLWIVISGAVDRGRHRIGLEQVVGRGRDQRLSGLGIDLRPIQPEIECV